MVRTICFLRYAIARHTALGDLLFAMQGLGSYPITLAGNDDQKRQYLRGVAAGDLIAAFAITEPEAGSDASALSLRAVRKGDAYILNGTKTLISNADSPIFILCLLEPPKDQKASPRCWSMPPILD